MNRYNVPVSGMVRVLAESHEAAENLAAAALSRLCEVAHDNLKSADKAGETEDKDALALDIACELETEAAEEAE